MSMGLLIGFVVAHPINWWLVANHLKHGMMTVRPAGARIMPFQPPQTCLWTRVASHGQRYQ
jgi:hypothetical protein